MSRVGAAFVLILFTSAMALPLAIAQEEAVAVAVTECKRECTPTDVNGPTPKTGDEPVKAILYGHFEDILNRAPLNAQQPDLNAEPNLNRGYLMPVVAFTTPVEQVYAHFENNWFYMFSSAGLVEIVDGAWRTHQEPGLAEDLILAGEEMTLYFYLSAHSIPTGTSDTPPGQTAKVGVMPQVGIYARMETGRYDFSSQSTIIAEGDTGAEDVVPGIGGSPGRMNVISTPTDPDIWEFKVPMKIMIAENDGVKKIPSVWSGAQGFIVSINPYQIKGDPSEGRGDGTQVMQGDWRVRIGPKTPVRIVLDMANPMVTKSASLSLFNDDMYVRWSFVSPLGSYDIQEKSVKVDITGPKEIDKEATGIARYLVLKRSPDHDGHFKPINATWKFEYQKGGLPDGEYTVNMQAMNLQGTYVLTEELTFRMQGGQPVDMQIIGTPPQVGGGAPKAKQSDGGGLPGFDLVVGLAAVAAALLVMGRRRK